MKQLRKIADLKYGRLNKENLELTETSEPKLDSFLEVFKNESYPDIKDTANEIDEIKAIQEKYKNDNNHLDFCVDADEDLQYAIEELCHTFGVQFSNDYYDNINAKTGYIAVKLKQHYNRPRPYQVAYYTEQDFNPSETVTGNSPAYPSGHALETWFLCLCLIERHPEHKEKLLKVAEMVSESRIVLGVHYPSDNEFGKKIAIELFKQKDIIL